MMITLGISVFLLMLELLILLFIAPRDSTLSVLLGIALDVYFFNVIYSLYFKFRDEKDSQLTGSYSTV